MALAGRNYYTVDGLMKLILDGLPGFNVRHFHLHTVWDWKNMENNFKSPGSERNSAGARAELFHASGCRLCQMEAVYDI